jgi:hypothetical protein
MYPAGILSAVFPKRWDSTNSLGKLIVPSGYTFADIKEALKGYYAFRDLEQLLTVYFPAC